MDIGKYLSKDTSQCLKGTVMYAERLVREGWVYYMRSPNRVIMAGVHTGIKRISVPPALIN